MTSVARAAFLIAAIASAATAQSYDLARVVWPQRIAVGMRQDGPFPPLLVEATKAGWVSIALLSARVDGGNTPPLRMLVEARDVEDWSKRAHILIDALTDSNPKKSVALPVTLGNGSFQLSVTVPFWRDKRLQMLWRGCGSVNSNTNPSIEDVTSLLALLDSAAAMAGGGVGRPPTLSRPYYSSEVSCPASADEANARPLAPASMATVATEIGVEMVVDTTGLVERSSIRVMRGTNPALTDSIRATVARWRFHAAEIDGTPVRQFVQTAVAIGPRLVPSDGGRIKLEATNDGWVHFRRGDATTHSVVQEWYDPDTVDAFAARMNALNREADTLRKDTNLVVQKSTSLGTPPAMVLTDGFFRHGKTLERPVSWVGCSGSTSGTGTTAFIDELVEMAKQARQRRTPPGDPSVGPFMWNEVTCPATLKWTQADRFGIRNVWHFPVGVYPTSMLATNARAEVLVSFVVDTTGAVEPSSIEVMPGADPRAVAQLPATLSGFLFRPAIRAGRKVRQRVIQAVRFEPPPVCASARANPGCRPEYSPR